MLNPLIVVAEVLLFGGPVGPLVLEVLRCKKETRAFGVLLRLCALLIKVVLPLRHLIHGSCLLLIFYSNSVMFLYH